MNIQNNDILNFHNLSVKYFTPILVKKGLQLLPSDDLTYTISIKNIFIKIQLIPSHIPDVVISFFSTAHNWTQNSALKSWGVNLLKFIEYQNPNFDFSDPRLNNRKGLAIKINYLSDLLDQYGTPLLQGDTFMWDEVSKQAELDYIQKLNSLKNPKNK